MEFALYSFEAAKFRGNKTKLVSPLDEAPSVAELLPLGGLIIIQN